MGGIVSIFKKILFAVGIIATFLGVAGLWFLVMWIMANDSEQLTEARIRQHDATK